MNDSTRKFFLYETIPTNGPRDIEFFTIADKHFLAVANHYDGTTYRVDSVIYQWNGHQFIAVQNISTNGAAKFIYFQILQDVFLGVANFHNDTTHFINSVIYIWKDNRFEKFQEIGTEGALSSTVFVINNETFMVFANTHNSKDGYSVHSSVFKWSGGHFVKLQSLQTYGAGDVKSFNNDGDTFLAFANERNKSNSNIDSFIYKWDGNKFVLFKSISTHAAVDWHPFVMCDQTFLVVANFFDESLQKYNIPSVVYQASGEKLIKYREIETQGAHGMTSFEYKGHTFLAVANYYSDINKKYNINSTLYRWI